MNPIDVNEISNQVLSGIILLLISALAALFRKWIWDKLKLVFKGISSLLKRASKSEKMILDKDNIKTLFVDDKEMPIVENLVNLNWDVRKISDITDIKQDEVLGRQVIFVDYDGVGGKFSTENQGVELIKLLRKEYGRDKYLVLYTSMTAMPTGAVKDFAFSEADAMLPKDANTSEFVVEIENAIKKLNGDE